MGKREDYLARVKAFNALMESVLEDIELDLLFKGRSSQYLTKLRISWLMRYRDDLSFFRKGGYIGDEGYYVITKKKKQKKSLRL
jgi:hypothetical protein